MSEYLDFLPMDGSRKTPRWSVQNHKNGTELGVVKWYGPWRQYCYFPTLQAVYSAGCMEDIATHIREQMAARTGKR